VWLILPLIYFLGWWQTGSFRQAFNATVAWIFGYAIASPPHARLTPTQIPEATECRKSRRFIHTLFGRKLSAGAIAA
jgi:DNA-binding transcriptional regulator of glucitol operon